MLREESSLNMSLVEFFNDHTSMCYSLEVKLF